MRSMISCSGIEYFSCTSLRSRSAVSGFFFLTRCVMYCSIVKDPDCLIRKKTLPYDIKRELRLFNYGYERNGSRLLSLMEF